MNRTGFAERWQPEKEANDDVVSRAPALGGDGRRGRGITTLGGERLFFPSADWQSAFARALAIGRRRQGGHEEDTQYVETRLAAVVTLDCLGANPDVLEGEIVSIVPAAPLGFEREFRPGEVMPPPSF